MYCEVGFEMLGSFGVDVQVYVPPPLAYSGNVEPEQKRESGRMLSTFAGAESEMFDSVTVAPTASRTDTESAEAVPNPANKLLLV